MAQTLAWIDELFSWADANNIEPEKLPRDKENLLLMTALNLSFCKLTQLPESLANLTHLTELDLAYNALSELPEWIDNLTALEKLDVSGNSITSLPDSLRHLPNLEIIGLDKQIKKGEKMASKGAQFLGYVIPIMKVLQQNGGSGDSSNVIQQVIRDLEIVEEDLLETTANGQSRIKNQIQWARFYLFKDGFIDKSQRGIWKLTKKGLETKLENFDVHKLFKSVQEHSNESKINMKIYQQKILFGSPGTGKSHKIDKQIIPNDLNIFNPENVIKTVFHPEYTYGDFVGKLMPITVGGNVQYKFYEGHFLKALSQAYKNIIAAQDNDGEIEKVALVIDEINRGNSAAIFGTIFQLLDRNPDGWSSYEVSVNEIIFNRLFELCDLKESLKKQGKVISYKFGDEEIEASELQNKLNCHFENRTIKIPPNLSILASMNTSDSSIYYMDSAFKRRWEWEFIDVDSNTVSADGVAFENRDDWIKFVSKLNTFIKSNHKSIRGIEDKQIGHFFITDEQILKSSVQNKLMFFLWDSVFNRDKKPLVKLLFDENTENELITFGDFATQVDLFIDKINGHV
ncbi:MAG: winged helix-turn-helix domain-containing protein [Methylococcales bacterium]|nr:winged helix-turn-helix domain-containing protein [Methylococcales bacterium]